MTAKAQKKILQDTLYGNLPQIYIYITFLFMILQLIISPYLLHK